MFHRLLFIDLCFLSLIVAPAFSNEDFAERTQKMFGENWGKEEGLELGENPALADYLRYGVQHNKGIVHIYHHWTIGVQAARVEKYLEDPELSVSQNSEERDYELMQKVPWFGKRGAKRDFALRESEEKWFETVSKKLALERDIKKSYFDYAFLKKQLDIAEDTLKLLKQMEPVAQRKIQGGENQNDLLRLQVEIGKMENEALSLQKGRQSMSAHLNAFLSRDFDSLLPWPMDFRVSECVLDVSHLKQLIRERNPELLTIHQHIAKARDQMRLADLERWPDFEFGVMRMQMRDPMNEDDTQFKVGVTLPIWAVKNEARRMQGEFSLKANQLEIADMENMLFADLETLLYQVDDASRQIGLYEKTLIPRAEQAVQIVEAAYRSGNATLLEVIDSQRTLLDFGKSLWEARKNHEQSLADLEFLCGGDVR